MNPNTADEHTVTGADFERPWTDLGERLAYAVRELGNLRDADTYGPENTARLTAKQAAVIDARGVWDNLNALVASEELTAHRAWLRYTDTVSGHYGFESFHPGYYEGVGLALSYQRGYGYSIDAPLIVNPHIELGD